MRFLSQTVGNYARRQDATRRALALAGKASCRVGANCGPVAVGDLLTTSSTPGHTMRGTDPARALGAFIGKVRGRIESGRGHTAILVGLQ